MKEYGILSIVIGILISKATISHHYHQHITPTALSNFSPSRSIFSYSHPAPASRPAQIVTPPGLRASFTTFTETWSPLQNSFTPAVYTADMASPLPLQYANTVGYIGDFSCLLNHLVWDSIPQRNPDLELVDQPCRGRPRFSSAYHDR
jgi:hypothetical protein